MRCPSGKFREQTRSDSEDRRRRTLKRMVVNKRRGLLLRGFRCFCNHTYQQRAKEKDKSIIQLTQQNRSLSAQTTTFKGQI